MLTTMVMLARRLHAKDLTLRTLRINDKDVNRSPARLCCRPQVPQRL